jgi:hypothetical protein
MQGGKTGYVRDMKDRATGNLFATQKAIAVEDLELPR